MQGRRRSSSSSSIRDRSVDPAGASAPRRAPLLQTAPLSHASDDDHRARRHRLLRKAKWWFLYVFVLLPTRAFFGVLMPPLLYYFWHNNSFLHLAQDDRPVLEHCKVVGHKVRFGGHPREWMDIIIPDAKKENLGRRGESYGDYAVALAQTALDLATAYPRALLAYVLPSVFAFRNTHVHEARPFPAVFFVHGGGFCAVEPHIQWHQCTAFVRAGFALYMSAYPHAPEDAHPKQLLAGLRALHWMRVSQGVQTVSLVGESAGGTLVTMLAVLLGNKRALREFARLARDVYKCVDEDVSQWTFPTVTNVVSWYGILDRTSWRGKGFLAWGLEFTTECHEGDLARCDFITLVEAVERGWVDESFPPCLLIAGTTDPLGLLHSSRVAKARLEENPAVKQLEYAEYDAGHAFIGLNPFVLYVLQGKAWRNLALPATKQTIEFMKRHHNQPDLAR